MYRITTMRIVLFLLISLSVSSPAVDYMLLLENGTIEQKTEAMHHLGYSRNKKAFWFLVKYLNFAPVEEDSIRTLKCRAAAAEALGRLQDERAVPYLIDRWNKEEKSSVKEKIMFAFKFYKNGEISPLISQGLSDEDSGVLFQSLITAAQYKDQSLAEKVQTVFTSNEDRNIKTAAAFTLIKLDSSSEEPGQYLANSLKSDQPWQRYWAAHFIAQARLTELIPDLVRSIEIENVEWVRQESERSVVILRSELKHRQRLNEYNAFEEIIN